jgi:hypothetical protein
VPLEEKVVKEKKENVVIPVLRVLEGLRGTRVSLVLQVKMDAMDLSVLRVKLGLQAWMVPLAYKVLPVLRELQEK